MTKLVLAMTENGHFINYEERKTAARERAAAAGDEALMILAADKISKVRELQIETADGDSGKRPTAPASPRQRFTHFAQCLELLERRLPGSPLVADLRAEVDQLSRVFSHDLAVGAIR